MIFSILMFLFILSSCWLMEKTIVGEGDVVKTEYALDDASFIEVKNISLIYGGNDIYTHIYVHEPKKEKELKIEVEGQQNIIDSITLKTKDDKLSITGNSYAKYDTEALIIRIYGYTFAKFDLQNARCDLSTDIKVKDLDVNLSGTSYLKLSNVTCDSFTAKLADASQFNSETITTKEVELTSLNSASFRAGLVATTVKANVSNASYLNIEFEIRDLDIEMSGSSQGTFSGYVSNKAEVEVSGASRLNAISLEANVADLDVMGASSLSIIVNNTLKGYVTGASSLTYGGNAKTTIESSGESVVKYIGE